MGYRGREEQDTAGWLRLAGELGAGPCPSEPKGETAACTELESLRLSLGRPAKGPSLRPSLGRPGRDGGPERSSSLQSRE